MGKGPPLDSALADGLPCVFGTLEPNRELLIWLRDYNKEKPSSEQIHFYGFDTSGCAPNPMLENAMAGFDYVFNYLDQVNQKNTRLSGLNT